MKSRRVQLIPRPQQMANSLQRQGRSARLVERRSWRPGTVFQDGAIDAGVELWLPRWPLVVARRPKRNFLTVGAAGFWGQEAWVCDGTVLRQVGEVP